MNMRSRLNASRKKIAIVSFSTWLLFAITLIISTHNDTFRGWVFVFFFLFMVAVIYALFMIRCAKCKGNLGYAIAWPPGKLFSISDKIKYCPFCGVNFDSEI